MSIPTETERKFIICMPSAEFLSGLPGSQITQTYLSCENETTERVRKRVWNDREVYTYTRKVRLSRMSSSEEEREITREEYLSLLTQADPDRTPVSKTRYLLEKAPHTFEIDIYPFWQRQAVMEVELTSETDSVTLPGEIRILREVTGDIAYSNASLSKQIPQEDP